MDQTNSVNMHFYTSRHGHVIYASVIINYGNYSCELQTDQRDAAICTINPSKRWLDLTLVKENNSVEISCNGGELAVFRNTGSQCKKGLNATFTSVKFTNAKENSVIYQKAPTNWKLAPVNVRLCHDLKENKFYFKIKTSTSPAWKRILFFSSTKELKIDTYFYVSESQISHVNFQKCHGSSYVQLKYCKSRNGGWVNLRLEKIENETLNIYCQGQLSLTLAAECAQRFGNDLTSFSVDETFYGSFLYQAGENGQGWYFIELKYLNIKSQNKVLHSHNLHKYNGSNKFLNIFLTPNCSQSNKIISSTRTVCLGKLQ